MQTLEQFIEEHGVTAVVEPAADNPNATDFPEGSNHFLVTLSTAHGELPVPFSQGPGVTGEPTAASVLDCLASDATLVIDHDDGVDMAIELGETISSSADVERARKTYATIEAQRAGLEKILGSKEAFEALVYEVERQ